MKSSLFNCDVCGAMCEADRDGIRPTNSDWHYIALVPYDPGGNERGNPLGLPSVRVDACSNKCAEAMLRKMADRIAEKRGA